ncbi:hypothetical protein DFJ77DRAFT_438513 [Powellomyces hirtus]|nr:hypothetical protein DFJ77DRAFT_438513 [Powellomyces hirtus]
MAHTIPTLQKPAQFLMDHPDATWHEYVDHCDAVIAHWTAEAQAYPWDVKTERLLKQARLAKTRKRSFEDEKTKIANSDHAVEGALVQLSYGLNKIATKLPAPQKRPAGSPPRTPSKRRHHTIHRPSAESETEGAGSDHETEGAGSDHEPDEVESFWSEQRKKISDEQLTFLPSGQLLEDVIVKAAVGMEPEAPVHSFIIDLNDDSLGSLLPLEDATHLKNKWEALCNSAKYQSDNFDWTSTDSELLQCSSLCDYLEKEFKNMNGRQTAEKLRRAMFEHLLSHQDEEGIFGDTYGNLAQVISQFLNNCARGPGPARNEREAHFMRLFDGIFKPLAPRGLDVSPPEETVQASKARKIRNASSDVKNMRGRKADGIWQTGEGDVIVWMEAKKGSWADDRQEAEHAKLKSTKGAKDCIDHIQRDVGVVVPVWTVVSLGGEWTLRCAVKLPSGVVLIGNICKKWLPTTLDNFRRLLDTCRVVLIWGTMMKETMVQIDDARFEGAAQNHHPPLLNTFDTPQRRKRPVA